MEKQIACALIVLIAIFTPIAGWSKDLKLVVRLKEDCLELISFNNTRNGIRHPWLKRGAVAFLMASKEGVIFPDSTWKLHGPRSYGRGLGFFSRYRKSGRPTRLQSISAASKRFNFPNSIKCAENYELFLWVLISQATGGRQPLLKTPIYKLHFSFGKIASIEEEKIENVPDIVLKRFEEERVNILAEEKSEKFVYW